MRILWHSNSPTLKTGYGQQTAIWAPRIKSLGHELTVAGYTGMQHAHFEWEGVPVLAAGTQHAIGMDVLGYYYEKTGADLVISLCDAWTLSPKLFRLMNAVCWTPVDAEAPVDERALGKSLRDFFDESRARPLAMSRWGQRMFARAGYDAGYIPHGIPTGLFKPPEDREKLRAESGFSPDTFVVLLNQANRSGLRKALPEQITAFWRFWKRHPDSKLLLHMAKNHQKGQDVPLLCDTLGFPEGVVHFPDQGVYAAGEIAMEDMPGVYGPADVVLGAAMAGGFELPLLEAQACGTPVITTDCSAMTEVAGSHSWLVPGQEFWVESTHEAFWSMPLIGHRCTACGHVDGIEAALEAAWQAREDGSIEQVRKASREHALQYDADRILREYWTPYLAELEASL